MAAEMYIFSLYKSEDNNHLLVRVEQEGFSNSNQNEEDQATERAMNERDTLIKQHTNNKLELIGEFQRNPEGKILYTKKKQETLKNLWYSHTDYGKPWIFLSIAKDQEDFSRIADKDEQILVPPSTKLDNVTFLTDGL